MNIETRPNAQMPRGKARNVLDVAGEDCPVFVDGVFIRINFRSLMSDYMGLHLITFVILFFIKSCVAKSLNMN